MTNAPVRTATLAGLVAAASLLMLAGPASAASRTFDDQKGDAARAIDVTSLTVRNATHRLKVDYGFRDLRKGKLGTLGLYVVPNEGNPVQFYATRDQDGNFITVSGGEAAVVCDNATVELSKDLAVWSIPQNCLGGNNSAVRVQAAAIRVADAPARGTVSYTDTVPDNDGVTSKIPFD